MRCDLRAEIPEDRNGEVYSEAFREYWAGNGKVVWIENDHIFGLTMKEIVEKMAKARGIKENMIRALDVEGDGEAKPREVREMLARHGLKKVLMIVPGICLPKVSPSLRLGRDRTGEGTLFLVKPANVSYFKPDKWWKSGISRDLMEHEIYGLVLSYVGGFRGEKKESGGEEGETERGRATDDDGGAKSR